MVNFRSILPPSPWKVLPLPALRKGRAWALLRPDEMVTLYHGTLASYMPSIRANGLVPSAQTRSEAMLKFWASVDEVLLEYGLSRGQLPQRIWEHLEVRWLEGIEDSEKLELPPEVNLSFDFDWASLQVLASLEGVAEIHSVIMEFFRENKEMVPPGFKILSREQTFELLRKRACKSGGCVVLTIRMSVGELGPQWWYYFPREWNRVKDHPSISTRSRLLEMLFNWNPPTAIRVDPKKIIKLTKVPCVWVG